MLAGSWLAHARGRPLIGLNFRQQRHEATSAYHSGARARSASEAIALDRGVVRRSSAGRSTCASKPVR